MSQILYLALTFITPALITISVFTTVFFSLIRSNTVQQKRWSQLTKFFGVWLLITLTALGILLTLTGGVNRFYFIENGIFVDERTFQLGIWESILISVPMSQMTNLATISILTGLIYSAIFTFPPACKTKVNIATTSSSASAATSAVASMSVCCSTSLVASVAPVVVATLGPITPILFLISHTLLLRTVFKSIIPRI